MPGPYSMMELPDLLHLWDRAAKAERGIKIRCSARTERSYPANNLMQKLNAVRRDTSNVELRKYSISVREDTVYIVPHDQIKSRVQAMREGRGL